jgi:hypothetical protein
VVQLVEGAAAAVDLGHREVLDVPVEYSGHCNSSQWHLTDVSDRHRRNENALRFVMFLPQVIGEADMTQKEAQDKRNIF